ncbi:FAD/NAD(P)-binding protein [Nocardia higoensis]|uniref:FAD/NAD(P)-binding protein n=1 Tax=Nocardia higoensis TaxID=228599 RepID=A0ABS0D5Q4_9NOCA|nr:FAD/NAD(P)-binding protein [Nocardia higoensis]MBF6353806.1 FAD/NAD(P)-binding protein [Nocardia higoensis]
MLRYRVTGRAPQTADTTTLVLEPLERAAPPFRAGQFMMLYRYGVGEVAISISADPTGGGGILEHTIRAVGAVSRALADTPIGGLIGVRGPFGTGWDVESATGRDLVVIGGGVGLAPLRSVVLAALGNRGAYRRVIVLTGARTPADILFRRDQDRWAASDEVELHRTVDHPTSSWTGAVGFVSDPIDQLGLAPGNSTAFLCGPEPMMRFCAQALLRRGLSVTDIRVSLERNMQCGIGRCGHCQLGPLLLCRDGPIVDYGVAGPLLAVREL